MARLIACVLTGVLVGCGGAQRAPQRAAVLFQIEPENARVYSDERFVGSARLLAQRPTSFSPGARRFTITAERFFPHDIEVDLPPGQTTIRVRLRAIPP